jgi:pimeloyl-ACP methyl ester carboxylesterase
MRRVVQPIKQPVSVNDGDPLVVHGADGARPSQLIVFVHGLNGHQYKTWGNFPQLFLDCGQEDVGLYGYKSGFARIGRLTARFDQQTEELAHQLRDCGYSQIVLIGHSMGGLLCLAAIRHLIDTGASVAIHRIAGIVLVGTPQAGSTRVPFWAKWISPDLKLLAAHSAELLDIQRRFTDHVVASMFEQSYGRRFTIPTFAVIGTTDRWVDDMSSTLRVPSDQVKRVMGRHTDISKPTDSENAAFRFTRDRVSAALDFHRKSEEARESIQKRLSTLVYENFQGIEQQLANSMIGVEPQ